MLFYAFPNGKQKNKNPSQARRGGPIEYYCDQAATPSSKSLGLPPEIRKLQRSGSER